MGCCVVQGVSECECVCVGEGGERRQLLPKAKHGFRPDHKTHYNNITITVIQKAEEVYHCYIDF